MAFSPTLNFLLKYQRKCKVGKNAILELSRAEMVRNTCFQSNIVLVTYGWTADPRVHALAGSNPPGHTFDNLDFVRTFLLA